MARVEIADLIMTATTRTPPPARALLAWRWAALALVAAGLLYVFPPFHIVAKKSGGPIVGTSGAAFDPVAFAREVWVGQLQPAAAIAPGLAPILADIRRDPVAAAKHHARQVGLGGVAYYFTRALGRVVAVEKSQILVVIDGVEGATVAVRTGSVFGNTVRDGCSLLEVNRVPGLAEFNALSAELNRLVEERVLPGIRSSATVGARLAFAGCAEAPESAGSGPLLTFIPVQAEVAP
jgi:predicted lipoprotein